MPSATIVSVWQNAGAAYMSLSVLEGARNCEYIGKVEKRDGQGVDTWTPLTTAEKKAVLVAAAKAVRDAQVAPASSAVGGMTGTVTI